MPEAISTTVKGSAAQLKSRNAVLQSLKRLYAGASRLSKRIGQAEAILILRIFYVVVFGAVALVMRGRRRNLLALEDSGPPTWLARRAPGTDPTKQY